MLSVLRAVGRLASAFIAALVCDGVLALSSWRQCYYPAVPLQLILLPLLSGFIDDLWAYWAKSGHPEAPFLSLAAPTASWNCRSTPQKAVHSADTWVRRCSVMCQANLQASVNRTAGGRRASREGAGEDWGVRVYSWGWLQGGLRVVRKEVVTSPGGGRGLSRSPD